jgi:hypothetical protein
MDSKNQLVRLIVLILLAAGASTAMNAPRAAAQLPTATGRQIAMSDPNWELFIPGTYQHRAGAATDLLVHFKGDPQVVWNNAAYADLNSVIVTINYDGLSNTYATPFLNTSRFQSILDEALAKLQQQPDFADTNAWNKVGVSSFSAGYGAVREILKQPAYRTRIDALLMADSLYAGKAADGTAVDADVVDFKTFAGLAKSGVKSFILDHSSESVSYASTTVCANEILSYLRLTTSPVDVDGLGPLHFFRHTTSGNFELWGEIGDTDAEHWQHLYNIGQFLKDMPLAKLSHFSADFDASGAVNSSDLAMWRRMFGGAAGADANADGRNDGADFLSWQQLAGIQADGVTAAAPVPEPAAGVLIVAAAIASSFRRRETLVQL